MKNLICVFFTFLIINFCNAQNNAFPKNKDKLYNRIEVLNKICLKLNKLNEFYKLNHPRGYSVINDNSYNFFIYDLADTINVSINTNKNCIEFIDKHIYHIASLNNYFKTSIILILIDSKLYFFEGLNCIDKINNIEDVFKFIKNRNELKYTEEVINRINNYKDYNKSYSIDNMSKIPKCECQ